MKRVMMVLVLSALLAACAAPAVEPTATPTATPLESFEALVAANSHFRFSTPPGNSAFYIQACADSQVIEISYNVETTDSLVSPYLGTIVYTVQARLTNGQAGYFTFSITEIYAFQSEAWTLKDSQFSPHYIFGHCTISKAPLP